MLSEVVLPTDEWHMLLHTKVHVALAAYPKQPELASNDCRRTPVRLSSTYRER